MCEKKKSGRGPLSSGRVSHQPSPARLSAVQQQRSARPEKHLGCSQQDGPAWGPRRLVPCANPRIHVRKSAAWALADQ